MVRVILVATGCLLVSLFALLVGDVPTFQTPRDGVVSSTLPEPPAAASFVAAYARVDPRAIAPSVSPLYRRELARRGDAGRGAFLPVPWDDHVPPPVSPWLAFRYLDQIADAQGFTHAFYLAHSRLPVGHPPTATLWRVDLDPTGRVIWGEMVFGLGEAEGVTASRTTRVRLASLPPVPVPPALARRWPDLRPTVVLALRSTDGDAYFVLGLVPKTAPDGDPLRPSALVYFAEDRAGKVFPGAWSYGEPMYRWSDSLHAEPILPVPVVTDAEPLREEYVATLWSEEASSSVADGVSATRGGSDGP
jgi:hypothetical protein